MKTSEIRNHLHKPQVPNAAAVFGGDGDKPLFNAPLPRQQQAIMQSLPDDAIISRDDGTLSIGRFIMSGVGLEVPDRIEADEWVPLFTTLFKVRDHISLWLADALAAYDRMPYGSVKDIADYFGYEIASIWNLKSIGTSVEYSRRREVSDMVLIDYPDAKLLSISHVDAIKALDTDLQDKLMRKVLIKHWSVAKLRKIVRRICGNRKQPSFQAYFSSLTAATTLPKQVALSDDQRRQLIDFHQDAIDRLRD